MMRVLRRRLISWLRSLRGRQATLLNLLCSHSHSVKTAKWVGDCFIYTNGANRLNYFIGSESYTITPFDQ